MVEVGGGVDQLDPREGDQEDADGGRPGPPAEQQRRATPAAEPPTSTPICGGRRLRHPAEPEVGEPVARAGVERSIQP